MGSYKIIQRIFCIEEEKIESALSKYPKAFSGGIAVVTYNDIYTENKKISDFETYRRFAEHFREKGINFQVNLSVTLGHGDEAVEKDAPAPFDTMVDDTGRRSKAVACPRDEKFYQRLFDTVTKYARLNPEAFWIDDDFRIAYHGSIRYGCFCENCIKKFNEKYHARYTRESLSAALGQNEASVRGDWQEFNRNALENLAELIAKAVHAVDENIAIGFMQVNYSAALYEGMPLARYVEIAKNKNGEVWFRHGSGCYSDRSPYEAVYKNLEIARLCALASKTPYKAVNFTEEVTSPYVRRGKSMKLTLLEAIMNIGVAGADGVMDEGIKPNLAEQLQAGNLVSVMHENYDYLSLLKDLTRGKEQIGVFPYFSADVWRYTDAVKDVGAMGDTGVNDWYNLFFLGIPFTFREKGAKVLLCSGKAIRAASVGFLEEWAKKAVYADGKAALEIQSKLGENVAGVKKSTYPEAALGGGKCSETFTSHALNGKYAGYQRYNIMANAARGTACLEADGAQTLSYSMNEAEAAAGVIGAAVYRNAKGGRMAVSARGAWSDDILSEAKGEQIKNVFDWLCGGKMPVRADSNLRLGQSVWEDENERVVFLYNLDFDNAENVRVRNDFRGAAELFNGLTWQPLGAGEEWIVKKIEAWSAAVLRIKKEKK